MKRFDFLKTLKERIVVLDGAMGTMLQGADLKAADYGGADFSMLGDLLNISRPGEIKKVHRAYLEAGADAVETNTFGSSELRLKEYDFSGIDKASFGEFFDGAVSSRPDGRLISYILSKKGAEIAGESLEEYAASESYDGRALFVIGSMGPSNYVLSPTEADIRKGSWELIENNFYTQALGLIDGGADVLLFETQQDILEIKAAVSGAFKAMKERSKKLPVMAQVTVDRQARMQLFNTSIQAAACALQGIGIDVFGINCSLGPDLMEKAVAELSAFSHLPISLLPNAGMPVSENGRTLYKLSPADFSSAVKKYVEVYGINIVGGCCGTGPGHIRELAALVKDLKPLPRRPDTRVFISGPQEIIPLDDDAGLRRIGERLNVRGSKKVREAVENDSEIIDYNALDEVVRAQSDAGLVILDVCMDSNAADTTKILPAVIRHVCSDFRGALCIDSFDPEALIAGVKAYPGRPMINSISLEDFEDGRSKLDAVVSKTAFFSPVYIALAADNKGPAVTAAEKIRIAAEIIKRCASYGVKANQLFIDINAFPIGSESDEEMNFALESLNAISGIKALAKGVRTIIGVSNLTNGLAKKPYMRKVLTSVFLDEAVKKGLDAAIVNPNHYTAVKNIDKKDYGLALKTIVRKDMAAFAELENAAAVKAGAVKAPLPLYDSLAPAERVREKIIDAFRQRADVRIEGKSYGDAIVSDAAEALSEDGADSLRLINNYLMPAMDELGKRFSAGTVSLPHLLRAADLMKQVMGWLEDHMKNSGATPEKKGAVVLGTVYQDVHCIGKDLAKTLLENYGYKVIDLGVQVPVTEFIRSAVKEKAVAVGASALLVQTSGHMLTLAREMKEAKLDIPLLIGGSPVNIALAAKAAEAGSLKAGELKRDVFYCPSAMDGVNVLERLLSGEKEMLLKANLKKLNDALAPTEKRGRFWFSPKKTRTVPVFPVFPYRPPEIKPFRKVSHIDIDKLKINFKNLKNLNWKMSKEDEPQFRRLAEEWIRKAKLNKWIDVAGISAAFPCAASGRRLFIYSISDPDKKIAEISFPAPVENSWFLSVNSKQKDICGFQISTAGKAAGKAASDFLAAGDSEAMFYIKGLADRAAEDYAEMLHGALNALAGLEDKKSRRMSPGYPDIPEAANNRIICGLLDAAGIGIEVNEAGLFSPESTTAAIVCFNPSSRRAE